VKGGCAGCPGPPDSRCSENAISNRVPNVTESGREKPNDAAEQGSEAPREAAGEPAVCGRVKHGASSERQLEPLREKHRRELLDRFPTIDEYRLSLLCDLLARIDLARQFVDEHGLMRSTREPHPLLQLLERWEKRAWAMLSALQPVSREPIHREPPIELLDPEVRAAAYAFLEKVRQVRERTTDADRKELIGRPGTADWLRYASDEQLDNLEELSGRGEELGVRRFPGGDEVEGAERVARRGGVQPKRAAGRRSTGRRRKAE
jgi:hypothetical protein